MLNIVHQWVASRKEREYRYVLLISIPDEELCDNLQTVTEDAFRLAIMGFDCGFRDVLVDMLSCIDASHKGYSTFGEALRALPCGEAPKSSL